MEALCTAKWARAYLWPRTPNFALDIEYPPVWPCFHLLALLRVLALLSVGPVTGPCSAGCPGAAVLLLLQPVFLVNVSVWCYEPTRLCGLYI